MRLVENDSCVFVSSWWILGQALPRRREESSSFWLRLGYTVKFVADFLDRSLHIQNRNLAPSWMTRVVTPCTPNPTAPKKAERILRSTVPGSGLKWFVRLKNSARNSRRRCSESANVLLTEKSPLAIPGSRIALVRGDVPKRPKGASVNAALLNHLDHVRSPPGRFPFCPGTRSGRELIP